MAGKIQTMIPQYGELNRIYRDYIDNYAFSFDRQKFISDFYQEYNDMKSFEAAILELVLDKQKEQYTLILNSLWKSRCRLTPVGGKKLTPSSK